MQIAHCTGIGSDIHIVLLSVAAQKLCEQCVIVNLLNIALSFFLVTLSRD